MRKKLFKGLKILGLSLLFLAGVFAVFMWTGIIWKSPSYYPLAKVRDLEKPVISMKEYPAMAGHARPYIYYLKGNLGEVYVLGIDHTNQNDDPQIDSITRIWNEYQPDIALVEGRLGFLFSWFQDPVRTYGESGKTVSLARKDKVAFYTWEPGKQDEINIMLKHYSPVQVAFFYSLRPYLSNYRFGKPKDPEEKMLSYIKSRTDYDGIRGSITEVAQIDSIWNRDFPGEKNWRDFSDQYGWPEGYPSEMAAFSNDIRNLHQISAILELAEQGKKVFVTMGSSHAFRIEETLRHELQK